MLCQMKPWIVVGSMMAVNIGDFSELVEFIGETGTDGIKVEIRHQTFCPIKYLHINFN